MHMNDSLYDDVSLERLIHAEFGVSSGVDSIIAGRIPVGRSTEATLFLTEKKQLFLYIAGQARFSLSDIQKIVSRVGLDAELYLPPRGRPHYFDEIGHAKFSEVFPGRKAVSDQDIAFYRTLAPYSPALVLIKGVKNGTIYQYDSDAKGGWRPHAKFSYRRIQTS